MSVSRPRNGLGALGEGRRQAPQAFLAIPCAPPMKGLIAPDHSQGTWWDTRGIGANEPSIRGSTGIRNPGWPKVGLRPDTSGVFGQKVPGTTGRVVGIYHDARRRGRIIGPHSGAARASGVLAVANGTGRIPCNLPILSIFTPAGLATGRHIGTFARRKGEAAALAAAQHRHQPHPYQAIKKLFHGSILP
mgnify:CR=1 FL=1